MSLYAAWNAQQQLDNASNPTHGADCLIACEILLFLVIMPDESVHSDKWTDSTDIHFSSLVKVACFKTSDA